MKKKRTQKETDDGYRRLLRNAGFKATPRRTALLQTLQDTGKPMSVAQLCEDMPRKADPTTIYRALEDLVSVGIVRKVDLKHTHTHYEIATGPHHHHLVCEECGRIEDVDACEVEGIERKVLRHSSFFVSITEHSLEFFGRCKRCV